MSLVPEIVEISVRTLPDQATIVPERREEITTEGGLDLIAHAERSIDAVKRLKAAGVFVSAFIGADEKQIDAAVDHGYDAVELHTGEYANADASHIAGELERLAVGAQLVRERGLRLHAGHGLNYRNVGPIASLPDMAELNIGHAIVSRAVFIGLREAVREMKTLIRGMGFQPM
jgi:pyridoxine 5-phosphate synthase